MPAYRDMQLLLQNIMHLSEKNQCKLLGVRSGQPEAGRPSGTFKGCRLASSQGFRYSRDRGDGIKRLCAGKGMRYLDASGQTVHDAATLARIKPW